MTLHGLQYVLIHTLEMTHYQGGCLTALDCKTFQYSYTNQLSRHFLPEIFFVTLCPYFENSANTIIAS